MQLPRDLAQAPRVTANSSSATECANLQFASSTSLGLELLALVGPAVGPLPPLLSGAPLPRHSSSHREAIHPRALDDLSYCRVG
jgi:hypothetical protein